jgi:hypothetical protein
MMQSIWSFLWAILLGGAGWMAKPTASADSAGDSGGGGTSAVPPPPLSPRLVEQYALAGCSDNEIADRFLIDPASLRRRFPDVLRAARAVRCVTLRRLQYDLARDSNSTMLIWLGRNELGQSLNPHQPGAAEPDLEEKDG